DRRGDPQANDAIGSAPVARGSPGKDQSRVGKNCGSGKTTLPYMCGSRACTRQTEAHEASAMEGKVSPSTEPMGRGPPVGKAFFPLDEELALLPGNLAPRQQEHLVHVASWMPFAQAARRLERLTSSAGRNRCAASPNTWDASWKQRKQQRLTRLGRKSQQERSLLLVKRSVQMEPLSLWSKVNGPKCARWPLAKCKSHAPPMEPQRSMSSISCIFRA